MINLSINGRKVQAPDGCTIMEAAKYNGINIPSLCYLENIHAVGSCRICVVEVEVLRLFRPPVLPKLEKVWSSTQTPKW